MVPLGRPWRQPHCNPSSPKKGKYIRWQKKINWQLEIVVAKRYHELASWYAVWCSELAQTLCSIKLKGEIPPFFLENFWVMFKRIKANSQRSLGIRQFGTILIPRCVYKHVQMLQSWVTVSLSWGLTSWVGIRATFVTLKAWIVGSACTNPRNVR